ncbi:MAG: HIT family protein [Sphaerochaetaceae bacterium]
MKEKEKNCPYCMEGDMVAKFAYPICTLDTCKVYVFKEQSKPGRCVCAYKEHVSEFVDLTDEERSAFFADVAKVAKAIHKAYHPDKLNYGAYGDTGGHLHFHLCPKYKGGDEWGGTFTMNSGKVMLTDAEYEVIAEKIRQNL